MFRPRWRKLWRDLGQARGRTAMMVLAIAASLLGIGTMLGAYAILTREIRVNYMGTKPPSATLELDRLDDTLLEAVRRQPGIAAAEARAKVLARVQVGPGQWRPLQLFVVQDFNAMQLATFKPVAGAWPPPVGTLLLERTAVEMVKAGMGGRLLVKPPHGPPRALTISGLVQDPALAPAWQERTGYGYITPATMAWLGETGGLDLLKIRVSESPMDVPIDVAAVDATARRLGAWLQAQGRVVERIQVPPPGMHPHQGQMTAVLVMMVAFSFMALGLSVILVATMVGGMLAQQVRQIGVMKAVGARTGQIAALYLVMVLGLSAVATALGVGAGTLGARAFAQAVAELLNFTLTSEAIPAWVYAAQIAAGLVVPALVALGPILRGSRITVREAISDFGVKPESFGGRGLDGLLASLRGLDRTLLMGLRNAFRRRGRLLLTLGLLAAGGGMFMTGLNVKSAWAKRLDEGMAHRHYDVEVDLNGLEPAAPILSALHSVPGVKTVEAWGFAPAALEKPGLVDVVRTYPDGGHGSFTLRAVPENSRLVDFPLLAGRWLRPGDTDAIVLNQGVRGQLPHAAVGDAIALSIDGCDGRPLNGRVVGIVEEIGAASVAYVPAETLDRLTGKPGQARSFRLVFDSRVPATQAQILRGIEEALRASDVNVSVLITDRELRSAVGAHIAILIDALLFMAVLMAVVGALGLASTMSTSVVERTREFGVMQAIGGTPRVVLRNVLSEGIFIGALSWVLAIGVSLPFSSIVGRVVGAMAFRAPLALVLSPLGLLLWLCIVLIGAALASFFPAWRASRLTVQETLAYT
ncbi:MAG: FtsX-like permease family protein [Holophagaceae bacterium]|nr:FtsX-like permease family protein [Holophagaceae bacterium]